MIGLVLTLVATTSQIPSVSLSPFDGSTSMDVEKAALISGNCGASVVRVIDVSSSTGSFFDMDQDGVVIVRQLHMPEVHLLNTTAYPITTA